MATAMEMLDKGEPEVALMFCDLARYLLGKSAAYVRQVVSVGNRQIQTANGARQSARRVRAARPSRPQIHPGSPIKIP
jgi:hypothetical protein